MYRGSRTLSKIVRDFSPRLNTHAHMFLPIYNLIDIYQKPIFLKNFPRIQLHFPHFESTRENAGKRCPFRSLVPIHFPNEKSFVEPSDISVCCHYINCVLCRLGLSVGAGNTVSFLENFTFLCRCWLYAVRVIRQKIR